MVGLRSSAIGLLENIRETTEHRQALQTATPLCLNEWAGITFGLEGSESNFTAAPNPCGNGASADAH